MARLATFALVPLSIATIVSASRLARLGFYYSSPAQTLVCYRCRQTFNVDDQLSGLQSHQQVCSSPAAAETPSTVTAPQLQTSRNHAHQHLDSRLPTITSSEVSDRSRCSPTHLDRSLTSGYKNTSHDETRRQNNMSQEYSTTSVASSPILRHQPDFERLKDETVRLSTFHDWPERAARIVEPRELARAGMFYTGQADRVQCAFCRGYLRNWVQGDRPADEHRRHFPDCSFIRQMNVVDDDDDVSAAATSSPSRATQHQLHTTRSALSSDQSCYQLQQSFQVGLAIYCRCATGSGLNVTLIHKLVRYMRACI